MSSVALRSPRTTKRTAPLTQYERTLLEIVQRRDGARRWHVLRGRRAQSARKTISERSAKGTRRDGGLA